MLEEVVKNLWLLLTIVIPGLVTYGAWRVILVLEPSERLAVGVLKQIDDSVLVTTSIIVAVALLQQAVAIVVEFALTLLAMIMRKQWPNFYTLFRERFALAATDKLGENATRIIGGFFQTTNISIGLGLLLLYFLSYESMRFTRWVPIGLIGLIAATVTTAVFRMLNAKWVVEEFKKGHSNKRLQETE